MKSSRWSFAKFTPLVIPLIALAGCATESSRLRDHRGGPGLALGSSGWYPSRSNDSAGESGGIRSPGSALTPPISPSNPWLGEIGLRQRVAGGSEFGCGIAVPNSFAETLRSPEIESRVRELGVGVWWKLDF